MVVNRISEEGTTPTLRLTAEMIENLSALSGVAYEKLGAIFPSLVAPTPAPTPMTSEWAAPGPQSGSLRWPIHRHFLERDFWPGITSELPVTQDLFRLTRTKLNG
jgi:hypothetical protein